MSQQEFLDEELKEEKRLLGVSRASRGKGREATLGLGEPELWAEFSEARAETEGRQRWEMRLEAQTEPDLRGLHILSPAGLPRWH